MDFRPIGNSILVRVDKESKVTPGGLFIPETANQDIWATAEVVATGPGKYSKELPS